MYQPDAAISNRRAPSVDGLWCGSTSGPWPRYQLCAVFGIPILVVGSRIRGKLGEGARWGFGLAAMVWRVGICRSGSVAAGTRGPWFLAIYGRGFLDATEPSTSRSSDTDLLEFADSAVGPARPIPAAAWCIRNVLARFAVTAVSRYDSSRRSVGFVTTSEPRSRRFFK